MSSLKKSALVLSVVVTLVALSAAWVQAEIINGVSYIQPVSASAFSTFTQPDSHWAAPPSSAISGLGLTAATGQKTSNPYPTNPPNNYRSYYMSATGSGGPGPNAWIIFNLGASYSLSGMHVWNDNGYTVQYGDETGRGIKNVDVYVSTDGINFGATPVQSFVFARAPGLDTYTGADYTFTAPVTAMSVKFIMQSNFVGGTDYVGLSEIRFSGTTTPEPSALVLLAGGLLGLLAYAWRKRK